MEEYKVNDGDLIDLSKENLDGETLACIVRTRTKHPGVETKRAWLRARLEEGHVFRKLAGNGCAFLEYAPVETAWVPVEGEGYLYLYCLWVAGDAKGHGVGARLMESLIDDAKKQGKAGVCMLSSERQMAWLSDRRFAERSGTALSRRIRRRTDTSCLHFPLTGHFRGLRLPQKRDGSPTGS